MTPIEQALAEMTRAERQGALKALDAISRPLGFREIEALAKRAGLSRSQSTKLAKATLGFGVIALVGPEISNTEGNRA